MKKINDTEIKYILASKIDNMNFGQSHIRELYDQYESRGHIDFNAKIVQEFTSKIKNEEINIVADWEPEYPFLLKQLKDHPLLIFCKGDIKLLNSFCITVVGTRRSTIYGHNLVEHLIKNNYIGACLVSGLAYGIDSKVHSLCIREGIPTIAVVAGGIDVGYPKRNQTLYNSIVSDGLIVAEFPPGFSIGKGMFPMRNRILSALSTSCVVVEAPLKSGSLITAKYSADLGREVFAFPGNFGVKNSEGCNYLIKDGANSLITDEDIELMYNTSKATYNKLLS